MTHHGINRHNQCLLHDVRHGLFVRQEFWQHDWSFDEKLTGQYTFAWIDSYQQYDLLDYDERKATEAAFQHGYLESLKTVQAKLQMIPKYLLTFPDDTHTKGSSAETDDAAINLIYGATEAARNARCLFQWKKMSALPRAEGRVGRIVYPTYHWRRAAYLRGTHLAMEQLVTEWNELAERHRGADRCLYTYLMEFTLPLLVVHADRWPESIIKVTLFPMVDLAEKDGQGNAASLNMPVKDDMPACGGMKIRISAKAGSETASSPIDYWRP